MFAKPRKIKIENQKLVLYWPDDKETIVSLNLLRQNCPCAFCNKEREEQSNSYIPLYSDDQIGVGSLEVIGNYALGVKWKDGHNTGIFEFSHLKNLSK